MLIMIDALVLTLRIHFDFKDFVHLAEELTVIICKQGFLSFFKASQSPVKIGLKVPSHYLL